MALPTKLFLLVLPLFAACSALPSAALAPQFYSQYETKVAVNVAERNADDAFEPVDDQIAYGLELEFSQPKGNTAFEIGFFYSIEEETNNVPGVGVVDFEGKMYEFSIGGRLYFEPTLTGCRPYFGGGVNSQYLERVADPKSGSKESDTSWAAFAPYLRGGLEWRIGGHLSVGLDYRIVLLSNLFHDIELGGIDADGNYQQYGLVVGWVF